MNLNRTAVGPGCVVALVVLMSARVDAQCPTFTGVCFPQGASSFADQVLAFNPSAHANCGPAGQACGPPTHPWYLDPLETLGPPDHGQPPLVNVAHGAVSLGEGGILVVRFLDNRLSNSGTSGDDLYVFEVGTAVESCLISVRPSTPGTSAALQNLVGLGVIPPADADGYYSAGSIGGSLSAIDIDAVFGPAPAGALVFDAVKIVDNCSQVICDGLFSGADIDAVGAISSIAGAYPGTAEDLILATGVDAPPTTGPGADVKIAVAGQLFSIQVSSPGLDFVGAPWLLAAQFVPIGAIIPPPAIPGLWLDIASPFFFILVDGTAPGPLGPSNVIIPSGNTLGTVIAPGLAGLRMIMQAAAVSVVAANGFFAMTDAHEILFL